MVTGRGLVPSSKLFGFGHVNLYTIITQPNLCRFLATPPN